MNFIIESGCWKDWDFCFITKRIFKFEKKNFVEKLFLLWNYFEYFVSTQTVDADKELNELLIKLGTQKTIPIFRF